MLTDKERVSNHSKDISEVAFRRLMGELKTNPATKCDVRGCNAPAICRVGCGTGHPSCENHARGETYISPLD